MSEQQHAPVATPESIDAARYRRLRVLGCATDLGASSLLRFANLDAFVDADIERQPSRGESPAPVATPPVLDVEALRDEIARVIRNARYGQQKAAEQSRQPCDHMDDASLRFMAIADMLEPLLSRLAAVSPQPAADLRALRHALESLVGNSATIASAAIRLRMRGYAEDGLHYLARVEAALASAPPASVSRAQVVALRDTEPRPTEQGRAYVKGWNAALDAVLALFVSPPARDDAPVAGAQGTCETCRHWRRYVMFDGKPSLFGACNGGAQKFTLDSSEIFQPPEDFGCTLHEPATPTPGAGGSR